jgi:hypothetical protein
MAEETSPGDKPPAEKPKYDQEFFLALAAKGKDAWNAWRRDPANRDVNVVFRGVDFSQPPNDSINFEGFEFGDGADFSVCKWRGVEWVEIQENPQAFRPGRASFSSAAFGDLAKFAGAAFGNWARFADAAFGDEASFEGRTAFGLGARFDGAAFGNSAPFNGAAFGDDASFDNAAFGDDASFAAATFGPALTAQSSAVGPASTARPSVMTLASCARHSVTELTSTTRSLETAPFLRTRPSKVPPTLKAQPSAGKLTSRILFSKATFNLRESPRNNRAAILARMRAMRVKQPDPCRKSAVTIL